MNVRENATIENDRERDVPGENICDLRTQRYETKTAYHILAVSRARRHSCRAPAASATVMSTG